MGSGHNPAHLQQNIGHNAAQSSAQSLPQSLNVGLSQNLGHNVDHSSIQSSNLNLAQNAAYKQHVGTPFKLPQLFVPNNSPSQYNHQSKYFYFKKCMRTEK